MVTVTNVARVKFGSNGTVAALLQGSHREPVGYVDTSKFLLILGDSVPEAIGWSPNSPSGGEALLEKGGQDGLVDQSNLASTVYR